MQFSDIFTFHTLEKPKKALSKFASVCLSVGNAHGRVFGSLFMKNGNTDYDEFYSVLYMREKLKAYLEL